MSKEFCSSCANFVQDLERATAAVIAGQAYIKSLEGLMAETLTSCVELFEGFIPDCKIYKPDQLPVLEMAISRMKNTIAEYEKEKVTQNETHTEL